MKIFTSSSLTKCQFILVQSFISRTDSISNLFASEILLKDNPLCRQNSVKRIQWICL